jgi:AcrR family transcriptional regulator
MTQRSAKSPAVLTGFPVSLRKDTPAHAPKGTRARIADDMEAAVLKIAFDQPLLGQDRVAQLLRAERHFISASGVRYVWQRHNIETLEKRVQRIERECAERKLELTPEQNTARARVLLAASHHHQAVASFGGAPEEFSRDHYILTIAARLFREQGYDATSLRDIARVSRVPIGSLYHHFKTKDELFAAVYEEGIRRLTAAITGALVESESPWNKLKAISIAHLNQMCGDDDFTATSVPTLMPSLDPAIRQKLINLNRTYESIFKSVVSELQLPPQIDARLFRLHVLGALNWTAVWYRRDLATPDIIGANLVDMLRLGLDPEAVVERRR